MVDDASSSDGGEIGRKGGLLSLIKNLLGRNGDSHLRDALEELIEESEERETPIASDERVLIANILKFGELTVYDVMVPRADILGVEVDTPLDALVQEVMRRDECIPREHLKRGDRVRAFIYDVRQEQRGPQIFLSRTHPAFMVGKRRRLLDYVKKKDEARYKTLIGELGIRR